MPDSPAPTFGYGGAAPTAPVGSSVDGLNQALSSVAGVGGSSSDAATAAEQDLGISPSHSDWLTNVVIPYGSSSGFMGIGPFGTGSGPTGTGANGGVTVEDLFNWVIGLPPDQLSQVQADLANAGYYGKLDSQVNEPTWGIFGTQDKSAFLNFFSDLVDNSRSTVPQSVESMLSAHKAQYAAQQSSLANVAPITEAGHVYDVQNLDPNEALDMVDKASMQVYGRTLSAKDRQDYAKWLNDTFTQRQRDLNSAHQGVDDNNAQQDAYAKSLYDPVTGKVFNTNQIVATARQYLGIPYAWGGKDPTKGLDCSGLVQAVYGKLGVNLSGTAGDQWKSGGGTRFTDPGMAQPGDLVFFGDMNDPNHQHVGIYIGNGMMIDAPHTGARVQLDAVGGFSSSMGLAGFEHFNQLGGAQMSETPPGQVAPPDVGQTGFQGQRTTTSDQFGTTAGAVGSATQVITQVAHSLAAKYGVDPTRLTNIALAAAHQESGLDPTAVGDGGTSFGLYQLHEGGELGSLTKQQALDPTTNATTAISVMAQVLKDNPSATPGQIAAMAQRPADPVGYAKSVDSIANGGGVTGATDGSYSATITGNSPAAPIPGPNGSTIETVNGRTVIVGQDTTVQSTDTSMQAMQDAMTARMRAANPAMAGMQDMVGAYGMLTKTLRDGITVNNN